MSRLTEPTERQTPAQNSETTHAPGMLADGERVGNAQIERCAELPKEFQRATTAASGTERTRTEARKWAVRAEESERAREEIAYRMDAARRDVYEANLRLEQAEVRAAHAEVRAMEAEARTAQAEARAADAEAFSDALMSSTVWRITWPLRAIADHVPTNLRRTLVLRLKSTWSLMLKLLRMFRKRRTAFWTRREL